MRAPLDNASQTTARPVLERAYLLLHIAPPTAHLQHLKVQFLPMEEHKQDSFMTNLDQNLDQIPRQSLTYYVEYMKRIGPPQIGEYY